MPLEPSISLNIQNKLHSNLDILYFTQTGPFHDIFEVYTDIWNRNNELRLRNKGFERALAIARLENTENAPERSQPIKRYSMNRRDSDNSDKISNKKSNEIEEIKRLKSRIEELENNMKKMKGNDKQEQDDSKLNNFERAIKEKDDIINILRLENNALKELILSSSKSTVQVEE